MDTNIQQEINLEFDEISNSFAEYSFNVNNFLDTQDVKNGAILAKQFELSLSIENKIYQHIQRELSKMTISSESSYMDNFKNVISLLNKYKNILNNLDNIQQKMTMAYHNLESNDKTNFMCALLKCSKDSDNEKAFENFLSNISYTQVITGTTQPLDKKNPISITFHTDLLKLICTQYGIEQIKDINNTLKTKYSGQKVCGTEVRFRTDKNSMTYSQNSTDVKFDTNKIKELNIQNENNITNYLDIVKNGLPKDANIQNSVIPVEKVQILLYPIPANRQKMIIKVGKSEQGACLSISPRICSFSHELNHMQRALNGQFYKAIPVPKLFGLLYDNLEELYAIQQEGKLLTELKIPIRITHYGSVVQTDKLMDSEYLLGLSRELLNCFCMGSVELNVVPNIFEPVKESVIQKIIPQCQYGNISEDISEKMKSLLKQNLTGDKLCEAQYSITTYLGPQKSFELMTKVISNLPFINISIDSAILKALNDCESTKLGGISTGSVLSQLKTMMSKSIDVQLIEKLVREALSNENIPDKEQNIGFVISALKSKLDIAISSLNEPLKMIMQDYKLDNFVTSLHETYYGNLCHVYLQNIHPVQSLNILPSHTVQGWQPMSTGQQFMVISENSLQTHNSNMPIPVSTNLEQHTYPALEPLLLACVLKSSDIQLLSSQEIKNLSQPKLQDLIISEEISLTLCKKLTDEQVGMIVQNPNKDTIEKISQEVDKPIQKVVIEEKPETKQPGNDQKTSQNTRSFNQ